MDVMEKVNGRLEPTPKREYANKKGKPFKCTNTNCGAIQRIEDVEFGMVYKCAICGADLTE